MGSLRVGHNLAAEQRELVRDADSQVPLQTYLSKSSGGWGPATGVLTSPPDGLMHRKVRTMGLRMAGRRWPEVDRFGDVFGI